MKNKNSIIIIMMLLLVCMSSLASAVTLSNDGGGSWLNYKDVNVGYKSSTYTPDANTVLYYPFSDSNTLESTYTPVIDDANSNDGTVNGAVSTSSVIGNGMFFDGVNDYIDAGNVWNVDANSKSLKAWIYVEDTATQQKIFAENIGTNPSINFKVQDNDISFTYNDETDAYLSATTDDSLTIGWHYVVAVYEGGVGAYVYVDGVLVASDTVGVSVSYSPNTGTSLNIGRDNRGINYFNGIIDEVILTNDVTTASEVYDYYTSTVTEYSSYQVTDRTTTIDLQDKTSDLIVYLPFDTDEDDESLFERDVTTTGGVTITTGDIGVIGEGMDFDGSDDTLENIYTGTQITGSFALWLNADTSTSNDMILLSNTGGHNLGDNILRFGYVNDGDDLEWCLDDGASELCPFINNYDLNNWHHIAGSYDGNTMFLYQDGILMDTQIIKSQFFLTANTLQIGQSSGIDGTLDEVKIWSSPKSSAEIYAEYQKTSPLSDTPYFGSNYIDDLRIVEDDTEIPYAFKDYKDEPISFALGSIGEATGDMNFYGGVTGGYDSINSFHYVNFDGANDYTKTNIDFSTSGELSMNVWFKTDGYTAKYPDLIALTDNSAEHISIRVRPSDASSGGECQAMYEGSGTNTGAYSGSDCDDGAWHMATITLDDDNPMKIYVDGEYKSSTPDNVDLNKLSSSVLEFGRKGFAISYYDGFIAIPKVYDVVLTDSEIKSMYLGNKVGTPVFETNFDQLSSDTDEGVSLDAVGGVLYDQSEGAFVFDGTDDNLDASEYLQGGAMTIAFDVDLDTLKTQQFISTGSWSAILQGLLLVGQTNGDMDIWIDEGSAGVKVWDCPTGLSASAGWQNVVFTWDGTTSTNGIQVYVDGTAIGTGVTSSESAWTGDSYIPIRIGSGGANTEWVDGKMRGVQIYDRVLSPTEVATRYNSGTYVQQNWKTVSSTPTRATFKVDTDTTETSNNYVFKDYSAWYTNPSATPYTTTNILSDSYYSMYSIENILLGAEQITNAVPTAGTIKISPSTAETGFEPITTSDLDCLYTPADTDADPVNATITWYKNSSSVVTNVVTYDYTWVNPTLSVEKQTTIGTGRVTETLTKDDMWLCSIEVTDGISTQSYNSTYWVTVQNDAPTFNSITTFNADLGTNEAVTPAQVGEIIKFTTYGKDAQDDEVEMQVCSNVPTTWADCTTVCAQAVTETFDDVTSNSISCTYDTSSITTTSNTFYVILRDSPSQDINISSAQTYYVNQPIVYTDISHIDIYGDTTYYFGEYIDYFAVDLTDIEDADSSLNPLITVRDPEGTIIVNGASMTYVAGTVHQYNTDMFLNAIGVWNVSVTTTDSDANTVSYSETFNVSSVSKSTDVSVYGWDYNSISDSANIESDIDVYGFKYIEMEFDSTLSGADWTTMLANIDTIQAGNSLAFVTLQDDLQSNDGYNYIVSNFADLNAKATGVLTLVVEVPVGTTVNTANDLQVNKVMKAMLQNTNNNFPIRVKNYNSSGINNNYGMYTDVQYLNASNDAEIITFEQARLKANQKNRMYEGTTDKTKVLSLHNNVISKLRSGLQVSTYTEGNVAELTNLDVIVFNNQSSSTTYEFVINSTLIGRDVYDYSTHRIVELENDGTISVEVSGYSADVIYFEDLSKIVVQSDDENLLYSATLGSIGTEETMQGTDGQSSWTYTESSTLNHYDGMIILNDPNYEHMDFYTYYGDLRELGVDNLSIYEKFIFGDEDEDTCGIYTSSCSTYDGLGASATCEQYYSNATDGNDRSCVMPSPWGNGLCVERTADLGSATVGNTGICSDGIFDDSGAITDAVLSSGTEPYGYMAIDDYCNPTSWTETDRQTWITTKKTLVDKWINVDPTMNIFLDGYDIGDSATCDNSTITDLFVDSAEEIADYIRVVNQRKLIFNTYTQYQDVVHMADGIMKESCVGRWAGTTDSPTYSYEDWSVEQDRYDYFQRFGVDVYCQGFGAQTDYDKAYYTFLAGKVLGYEYISYNQPKFWYAWYNGFDDNWNHNKFPNVGTSLDGDMTDEGDGIYSRRYENGLIRINTTAHTGEFITDQSISSMQICAQIRDRDDTKEGQTRFVLNEGWADTDGKTAVISDSDVTNDGAFHEVCVTLDEDTFYEPSGYYEWKFFYACAPVGTGGSCQAMVQSQIRTSYNDAIVGGRRSGLDDGSASNEDHINFTGLGFQPDLDEATYLTHDGSWATNFDTRSAQADLGKWYNFDVRMVINRTASKLVDTIPSATITRSEAGVEKPTVSFTSAYSYGVPIYDRLVNINRSIFRNIYVNDSALNYANDSSCITSNPTFNTTLVDGYNWSACYYDEDTEVDGYYVKVIIPHLSTQQYTIDGNLYPNITTQNITLVSLLNGSQQWTATFNVTEPDSDTINRCGIDIDGTVTNGTFTGTTNGSCAVTFSSALNTSTINYTPIAYDEWNDSDTGTSESGLNYDYSNLISNGDMNSTDSVQYVYKVYNFTNNQAENYTNMNWTRDAIENATIINVTESTLTQHNKELALDLVTLGAYTYVPDAGGFYFVDGAEVVKRGLTLAWANSTDLGTLPVIDINYVPENYVADGQSVTFDNLTAVSFENGTTMSWNTTPITTDSSVGYKMTHNAKVVYSENNVITSSDALGIRTYNWNSGLGKYVNFMFADLVNASNTIYDNINYSDLTDWADRLTTDKTVTNELSVDRAHTFVDNVVGTQAELTFSPVALDDYYVYDLEWSAYFVTTECNDGLDNDGDTKIDTLDGACHTDYNASNSSSYNALLTTEDYCGDGYIDSSEQCDDSGASATCTASCTTISTTTSSGGGGGGSSTTTTTTSPLDLTKVLCDISVIPSQVKIVDDNPVVELTIQNRESVSYSPEYEFRDVVGRASIEENVQLTNEIGTVLKSSTKQFGVQYKGGIFGSTAVHGNAELVLSNARCRDIIIPIEMNINASNPIAELITGDEPILERVTDFVNEPITEQVNWSKLWMLIGLFGLLFGAVLWDKAWSENEFVNWTVKGFAWVFLTGLATSLIVAIVRAIIG